MTHPEIEERRARLRRAAETDQPAGDAHTSALLLIADVLEGIEDELRQAREHRARQDLRGFRVRDPRV